MPLNMRFMVQGVVLEIRGDVATIAFGHTIGVKKLNAAHPSLKKA